MFLKFSYAIGITLDRDEARKATLLRDYIHDTVRRKAIVALPSLIDISWSRRSSKYTS